MVKYSRNKKSKTRTKRTYKKRRILKGGSEYTAEQKQQLSEAGFTQEFIKMAEKVIGFSIMWRNFKESELPADKYMAQTYNDLGIDPDKRITDSDHNGGKKRCSRKYKSGKRRKSTSKYFKGGACYGNGVGANNYDSNFSVYNTRELQLFPYRPTN
jgi:hypothetical protein